MLVVRSQDREDLIVDDVMYSIEDSCISVGNTYRPTIFIIARYSTEEKALKVLDMLEKHIMNCGLHNKVNFQFPQDEEVE